MARQIWKDAIEGVGIFAIVASLIFVGIETKNSSDQTTLNTQALEISAYQELMNNISDVNTLNVESDEAAAVTAQLYGRVDVDSWRLESALFTQFRHGDMAYFMFEKGVIAEDRLLSALRPLPLSTEIGLKFWSGRKVVFVPGYRNYVDRLIAEEFWGAVEALPPILDSNS